MQSQTTSNISKSIILQLVRLQPLLLGLFIGAILFNRTVSIGFFAAFMLIWLISFSYKEKLNMLAKRKILLLLPVLFLYYALSLMYSQHSGAQDLEKRLFLLVIPIVVGSTELKFKDVKTILRIYIFSCLAFTINSIIKAYNFYNLPTEHFTLQHLPHQLAAELHAPYLSLLLVLANFFVLFINSRRHSFIKWDLALLFYFSLFVLILSSRTALFCNISLLTVYLYLKLVKSNKVGLFIACLCFLVAAVGFTYKYYPHLRSRVTDFSSLDNGISPRLTVIRASLSIIKEHPLVGVGIGDVQPMLSEIYSEWSLSEYFFSLNPHNEYLFTGIALGTLGVVLLLCLLAYPIFLAAQLKEPLLSLFYFIFLLAFLTEVVLARYWGVAAFSFFYTLFTAQLIDRKKKLA